ncbi:hypothetical protein JIN85_07410 [Luteolibacter pohnpeiensis]|uniref:Teneurin-like YD-shell domain-containing protein n=1 Tax=Luteolibacter pohnpeiensis TaxID=454153 RepID=A0A934S4A4_9BACT|nr:RHS repeat-associated core domain-containing protein [Luteolibacter pohnpeiensis]MBK1882236.1 hypothetical protein [Luteolibacter pohnpeiensis]
MTLAWTSQTGALARQNDYDPFGNVVMKRNLLSGVPDFGFSTKLQDTESGLLYYGYRYYDPITGRWPSRDPIGERGGINLYGFVGNDGINQFDFFGLAATIDDANAALANGLDCGCYKAHATFSQYETWTNGPDGGIKADISISAVPTNKDGCACDCKETKLIQMVKTENAVIPDFRHRRTGVGGWRIDAEEHLPYPFVSDTSHASTSGLNGHINDTPGNRRIKSSGSSMRFTAVTCLVCSDPNAADKGKVLACVSWGYTMAQNRNGGPTGSKIVKLMKPYLQCGNNQSLNKALNDAVKQWNVAEGRNKVEFELNGR